MSITTIIKQGDTRPLSGRVTHESGEPPLQGASSLLIFIREADSEVNLVNGEPVTILSEDGEWMWEQSVDEVNTPGRYNFYLKASYVDDTTMRFPNRGFNRLQISPNLE